MTAFTAESALSEVASNASTPRGVPGAPSFLDTSAPLTVQALSFRYPGSPLPLLDRVSFTVAESSLTVLSGPSGCGKTTLMRLLAGLLTPESGTILRSETAPCSYVPQEPHIFNATLLENITLFHSGFREDDVRAALEHLSLDSWLAALPQGLATPLGEGGQSLSQGQRKRLGLARALVQGRPLILLDEPTAALDETTASTIREVLLSLRGTHTLFVISHDEQLQAAADHLLTFDAITMKGGTAV